jgi:hypothetical protein
MQIYKDSYNKELDLAWKSFRRPLINDWLKSFSLFSLWNK